MNNPLLAISLLTLSGCVTASRVMPSSVGLTIGGTMNPAMDEIVSESAYVTATWQIKPNLTKAIK